MSPTHPVYSGRFNRFTRSNRRTYEEMPVKTDPFNALGILMLVMLFAASGVMLTLAWIAAHD